jgi:hypothetical protein
VGVFLGGVFFSVVGNWDGLQTLKRVTPKANIRGKSPYHTPTLSSISAKDAQDEPAGFTGVLPWFSDMMEKVVLISR